jgi:predicted  nucleic acid-binding Zn-ribbon protein
MNRWAGLVAALILAVSGIGIAAQQSAPMETELLAEVRLLRQSIEALAGTNARVQIAFGRLQLQEQRTATAARRLDDLRNAVSGISMRAGEMGDRIKELEEGSNDGRFKPEQLEGVRQELIHARRELGRIEAERARLMGEESEAAGVLNQEQGRWSDLNRQLEELERALTPKPQ